MQIGCIEDSPLSEISLTDPSIIEPHIFLSRSIDLNNIFTHEIEVWIFDKNNNTVEILDGGISVNGLDLLVKYASITNAPYYSDNGEIDILLDSLYSVSIMLSDGEKYYASVRIQDNDLNLFNVPETHNHLQDLPVSWQEIDENIPMSISMGYYFGNSSKDGMGFKQIDIPEENLPLGYYDIPSAYLSDPEDIYHVSLTLTSRKNGTIDNEFKSGSYIVSNLSIKADCDIE